METPGHTPESISVLVYEHADDDVAYGVLTGDALFIGDVGRPDLLASVGVTADELGEMLYDSIQHKLMGLPDDVRVFPAHGAGSACGKNLSTELQSTIGEQRKLNYACQPMSQERFIAIVTEGQPSAPSYFVYNATLNKQEREVYDEGVAVPALDDAAVEAALAGGAVVHDARSDQDFGVAHLRGSINVPADGRMAETVGMVLAPQQSVVVIAQEGQEQEVATRFARIGFDNVVGFLPEPERYFLEHEGDVEHSSRLTVTEVETALADDDVQLVDIRNAGELADGMIPGAVHIPLAELPKRSGELDPSARCCSTAPAAGAARWARARCGPRASLTSPTCWAATTPGCSGSPRPPDPSAAGGDPARGRGARRLLGRYRTRRAPGTCTSSQASANEPTTPPIATSSALISAGAET